MPLAFTWNGPLVGYPLPRNGLLTCLRTTCVSLTLDMLSVLGYLYEWLYTIGLSDSSRGLGRCRNGECIRRTHRHDKYLALAMGSYIRSSLSVISLRCG